MLEELATAISAHAVTRRTKFAGQMRIANPIECTETGPEKAHENGGKIAGARAENKIEMSPPAGFD